jgi:hypothetical protein
VEYISAFARPLTAPTTCRCALIWALTCDDLVYSWSAVDFVEGCPEVRKQGSAAVMVWGLALDLDGVVAAAGLGELRDGPAGLVLDPATDCRDRENDLSDQGS